MYIRMLNEISREQFRTLKEIFSDDVVMSSEDNANVRSIREAARYFTEVVLITCPEGKDREEVIRKIREAMYLAVASIPLRGKELK